MSHQGPGGLKTTLPIATYPYASAGRFQGRGPWVAFVFWHADCDGEPLLADDGSRRVFPNAESARLAARDLIGRRQVAA